MTTYNGANPGHGDLNKHRPSITLEMITPELAREYLSFNFDRNRSISKPKVASYASQMTAGSWALSDGLIFDKDGVLIDGQHRLHAVIKAGITVAFYVLRGIDPEAKEFINIGMTRSASNIAEIRGLEGSTATSLSIARRMTTPRFKINVDNGLTKHEVVDIFSAFHDGIMFSMSNNTGHTARSGSVLAVVARAYYHENHVELERFVRILKGDMSAYTGMEDSAAVKLREHYLDQRSKKENRANAGFRLSLFWRTQAALSAFLERKPLTICREKTANLWPIPALDSPHKFKELRAKVKADPSYRYA